VQTQHTLVAVEVVLTQVVVAQDLVKVVVDMLLMEH
jgi:hypothetical protein